MHCVKIMQLFLLGFYIKLIVTFGAINANVAGNAQATSVVSFKCNVYLF